MCSCFSSCFCCFCLVLFLVHLLAATSRATLSPSASFSPLVICHLSTPLFGSLASFLHQSPKATFCNPSLHPSSTFITVHQPPTLFPFTFLISVQPYPFSLICSGIPQFTLTSISRLPQLLPSLILPLFANITRDDTALPLGLTTVTQSRSYNHISPFPAHSPTSTSIMVSTFFVESGDSVSS